MHRVCCKIENLYRLLHVLFNRGQAQICWTSAYTQWEFLGSESEPSNWHTTFTIPTIFFIALEMFQLTIDSFCSLNLRQTIAFFAFFAGFHFSFALRYFIFAREFGCWMIHTWVAMLFSVSQRWRACDLRGRKRRNFQALVLSTWRWAFRNSPDLKL